MNIKSAMYPRYCDSHTHVNFPQFEGREEEVISEAREQGVWMINVGTSKTSSQKAIDIAERYDEGVYATVGVHPVDAAEGVVCKAGELRHLTLSNKVVGIGECGLDFFHIYDEESKRRQREAFVEQIELANEAKLPLMLHIRSGKGGDAYAETLALLKKYAAVPGNAHFFAGTEDNARDFLSLGFTLSFNGVLTITDDYNELVTYPPLDAILSETDAPYVAPKVIRGRENRPVYVTEAAHAIASLRPEDDDRVYEALFSNARRVFSL